MKIAKRVMGGIALAAVLAPWNLAAQNKQGGLSVEERLDILAEELEKLKLKKAVKTYESVKGLGPAASGVYRVDQGISWGGYGEIKYRNFQERELKDIVDVHRFILYAGYRFNNWIVLNTELEYEHAGFRDVAAVTSVDLSNQVATQQELSQGQVFVEFAYIDFEFSKPVQLALGLNLVPMGITSYLHEPTTFYSTERPQAETRIIPTTWREIGAIFHGDILGGDFVYRAGIINGGRAAEYTGANWIRGGRTKGSLARAVNFAGVFNLEYKGIDGLIAGGSVYSGESGQNEVAAVNLFSRINLTNFSEGTLPDPSVNLGGYFEEQARRNRVAKVRVSLAEAHFRWKTDQWDFRGLFARGWISDSDARAVNKLTGQNIGKTAEGGYIEVAYNIMPLLAYVPILPKRFLARTKTDRLMLFVRNEYVNTQKQTATRSLGGREDIQDTVCASSGICRTTAQLTNGNRDIGIIENTDTTKESYGVKGVPDRVNDRRIVTTGMAYFPHPNVVVKLDYERWSSKSDLDSDISERNPNNNKSDRVNFSVGFIF